MKKILISLFSVCLLPLSGQALQVGDYVILDTTLILHREDYSFEAQEDGTSKIVSANAECHLCYGDYDYQPGMNDAAIPLFVTSFPVDKDEVFHSVQAWTTEELDEEDFLMNTELDEEDYLNWPTGAKHHARHNVDITYRKDNYPENHARYYNLFHSDSDNRDYLGLILYPFRYDAANKKLYFCKEIKLHITLKMTDGTAVTSPALTKAQEQPCYDLMGRHVKKPQQGIVLQQGRKRLARRKTN